MIKTGFRLVHGGVKSTVGSSVMCASPATGLSRTAQILKTHT